MGVKVFWVQTRKHDHTLLLGHGGGARRALEGGEAGWDVMRVDGLWGGGTTEWDGDGDGMESVTMVE